GEAEGARGAGRGAGITRLKCALVTQVQIDSHTGESDRRSPSGGFVYGTGDRRVIRHRRRSVGEILCQRIGPRKRDERWARAGGDLLITGRNHLAQVIGPVGEVWKAIVSGGIRNRGGIA